MESNNLNLKLIIKLHHIQEITIEDTIDLNQLETIILILNTIVILNTIKRKLDMELDLVNQVMHH